jgi:hypothetical protein
VRLWIERTALEHDAKGRTDPFFGGSEVDVGDQPLDLERIAAVDLGEVPDRAVPIKIVSVFNDL